MVLTFNTETIEIGSISGKRVFELMSKKSGNGLSQAAWVVQTETSVV
jgi:hypothetical protein